MSKPLFKTVLAAIFAGAALAPFGTAAQTLQEALAHAYNNSPTLLGRRAELRATDEGVSQAMAGWRPTVTYNADISRQFRHTMPEGRDPNSDNSPWNQSINLSQALFRGGRTVASVNSAEANIQAGRATLVSTEQTVLQNVVQAYMDVVRDRAVIELTRNNVMVLERQLQAARDRFSVGEVTRTDVAQAEARLAAAIARRTQAEGSLTSSRAVFERTVGFVPDQIQPPPALPPLPTDVNQAWQIAMAENPDLQASIFREESARHDIDVAFGGLLPSVSLSASMSRNIDTEFTTSNRTPRSDVRRFGLNFSVPLYEAGATYSQIRQRKEIRAQRRLQIDEARNVVRQAVIQSLEGVTTARAAIEARRAQVAAAELALEGVIQEAQVGARATIEILDAEQELLDARVALVQAERDEYVAGYNILQAVGRLTARNLGLPVELYDPVEHYESVRNKWFGLGDALEDIWE